jgi:eukaryotic-like serine/threonine-protein kinase
MSEQGEQNHQSSAVDLVCTQPLDTCAPLTLGKILVGRFELISLQGAGQFGQVYRAKDLLLNTDVAVKILHISATPTQQSLTDFKNEILLLRKLSHPHILRVHEYYQDEQLHFITMDWVAGESLAEKISKRALTNTQIVQYSTALLDAIEYAQQQQIVHRDLKPENILIDNQDRLIVADFGLATMLQTSNQACHGSPAYCPPEYLNTGAVNQTTDLYAFGVILYQMCCNQLPFSAQNIETLKQIKYQPVIKLPASATAVTKYGALLTKLLAAYPGNRPQTASALRLEFEQLTKQQASSKWHILALITVSSLILLSGIYLKWDNKLPSKLSYHSLAILPVQQQHLSSQNNWLAHGIPVFLSRELKEQPNIRLIDIHRVANTINLLGFELPLNEAQMQAVSDLLHVDYLLQASTLSTGAQQQELTVELINIVGNSRTTERILQRPVDQSTLSSTISELSATIGDRLGLGAALQHQSIVLNEQSLILLAEIQEQVALGNTELATVKWLHLLTQTPDYAQGWLQLGELLLAQDKQAEAEQAFKQVKQRSAKNQLSHQLADAYLFQFNGAITQQQLIYQQLIIEFPYRIDLRFKLAQLYQEHEQTGQANDLLLQIVAQDPNHPKAWLELAKLAIMAGKMEQALNEYLVRALIIANRLNDQVIKGDVLNAFGVAYQRIGDIDQAIDNYNQALRIRQQLDNKLAAATTMSNLASLFAIRGDYAQAENYLRLSLTSYQLTNDQQGTSDLYNELGVLKEEQGHYQQALEYYRQSLNIRMELSDDWLKAESLNNVGYLYFLLADNEHATVYWQQAARYYKQLDDPIGSVRVQQNFGQLALQKGDWKTAYQLFERSLGSAKKLGLNEESIVAQAYLAKLAFIQGGFAAALTTLDNILLVLTKRQDFRGIIEFSLWSSEWCYQVGDVVCAQTKLQTIEPLLINFGNQEQKMLYEVLNQSLISTLAQATTLPNKPVLPPALLTVQSNTKEIPVAVLIKRLLYLAELSLPMDISVFESYVHLIRAYPIEQYPYENIKLIELEAINALHTEHWNVLNQKIIEGKFLLKKLGNYWRGFQFDYLQAALLNKQNKAYVAQLTIANTQLSEHLKQLPDALRSAFRIKQNQLYTGTFLSREFAVDE